MHTSGEPSHNILSLKLIPVVAIFRFHANSLQSGCKEIEDESKLVTHLYLFLFS